MFTAELREQDDKVTKLESDLRTWSQAMKDSATTAQGQFEIVAQAAHDRITETQKHINNLIEFSKLDGQSSNAGVFLPAFEFDRNVFDPRDHKIADIPDT